MKSSHMVIYSFVSLGPPPPQNYLQKAVSAQQEDAGEKLLYILCFYKFNQGNLNPLSAGLT